MGEAMQVAIAGDYDNQRLEIHHNLGPAKNHQAETALQNSFDQDPRPHMKRREGHGVSLKPLTSRYAFSGIFPSP